MSNGELKFPWQDPLVELMLESEREKVSEHAEEVETVIFGRLHQLREESDGHRLRQAISDALSLLRTVKRDKLGFPDWE